jgi:hypothetical protein
MRAERASGVVAGPLKASDPLQSLSGLRHNVEDFPQGGTGIIVAVRTGGQAAVVGALAYPAGRSAGADRGTARAATRADGIFGGDSAQLVPASGDVGVVLIVFAPHGLKGFTLFTIQSAKGDHGQLLFGTGADTLCIHGSATGYTKDNTMFCLMLNQALMTCGRVLPGSFFRDTGQGHSRVDLRV